METLVSMINGFIKAPTREKFDNMIDSKHLKLILLLLIYKHTIELFTKFCKKREHWDLIYSNSSDKLQKLALEKLEALIDKT